MPPSAWHQSPSSMCSSYFSMYCWMCAQVTWWQKYVTRIQQQHMVVTSADTAVSQYQAWDIDAMNSSMHPYHPPPHALVPCTEYRNVELSRWEITPPKCMVLTLLFAVSALLQYALLDVWRWPRLRPRKPSLLLEHVQPHDWRSASLNGCRGGGPKFSYAYINDMSDVSHTRAGSAMKRAIHHGVVTREQSGLWIWKPLTLSYQWICKNKKHTKIMFFFQNRLELDEISGKIEKHQLLH